MLKGPGNGPQLRGPTCQRAKHQKQVAWFPALPEESCIGSRTCQPGALEPWVTKHRDEATMSDYYYCWSIQRRFSTYPPSWFKKWVEEVQRSGYLTPATIVSVCGGPVMSDQEPPPLVATFGCSARKRTFGDTTISNCSSEQLRWLLRTKESQSMQRPHHSVPSLTQIVTRAA